VDNTEGTHISITARTQAGTLINVRAEDSNELDQLIASSLDAIKSAVIELEATARIAAKNTPPMAPAQVAAALGASIIDTPPSINGRNCPHGRMTAIQGTGKDGNMYRGYFCPAPKGALDKCKKNQYVFAGTPQWNTFVPDQVK